MCGIVGTWGGNLSNLKAANLLLTHRGPDDGGIYKDDKLNIGLGHRRLSIIDTSSSGRQPMYSNDGKTVLVFNGEIYNYKELRSELQRKGFVFQGRSDTEVF